MEYTNLIEKAKIGDFRSIARLLSLVENESPNCSEILNTIQPDQKTPIIGITGPPGAGKSTLVNAIIAELCLVGNKIAVLAVDPTSPFNFGSLLGDRIRMSNQFSNTNIFIRSVATRGSLGGISAKSAEMTDVLKACDFDFIFIETVGVGQSEVEIAGIADKTIVVFVPEAGDEIQNLKSGIMEIADAFVVNKADREGAETFANNLHKLIRDNHLNIPVFQSVADKDIGIKGICSWINRPQEIDSERKKHFIAERIYKIIETRKMANVQRMEILKMVSSIKSLNCVNPYQLADQFMQNSTTV